MEAFDAFDVVVNHEEQYSLWPSELELPSGWRKAWGPAAKPQCLDWIEENWTDMEPASLRRNAPVALTRT